MIDHIVTTILVILALIVALTGIFSQEKISL
jgi:hypothetical protein